MRKKGFAVFVVVLLMSSSLNAQDCEAYASRAAVAELNSYSLAEQAWHYFSGNINEWYGEYLSDCEEINASGGTALDPVFL